MSKAKQKHEIITKDGKTVAFISLGCPMTDQEVDEHLRKFHGGWFDD